MPGPTALPDRGSEKRGRMERVMGMRAANAHKHHKIRAGETYVLMGAIDIGSPNTFRLLHTRGRMCLQRFLELFADL